MSKILGDSAFEPLMNWVPPGTASLSGKQHVTQPAMEERRILPSRRKVLVAMATIPPVMAVAGWPHPAMANPLVNVWSLGRPAFKELVKWLFNTALKGALSVVDLEDTDILEVSSPSLNVSKHHDMHASLLTVSPRIVIKPGKTNYGCWVRLDRHVWAHDSKEIPKYKDMNGTELRRCRHVNGQTNGEHLLFPCGPRKPPTLEEQVALGNFCRQKGIDRSDYELKYCRPFNDGKSLFRGFAIQSTKLGNAGTDILISDDP